jgi:hypothetical protein
VAGRVEGKVVLITGAARPMGRAYAVRLAEEGADIVAVDRAQADPGLTYGHRTIEDLAGTASLVESYGRRVLTHTADVRDQAALNAVVAEATETFGGIDVLVSNAGISSDSGSRASSARYLRRKPGARLVGRPAPAPHPSSPGARSGSTLVTHRLGGAGSHDPEAHAPPHRGEAGDPDGCQEAPRQGPEQAGEADEQGDGQDDDPVPERGGHRGGGAQDHRSGVCISSMGDEYHISSLSYKNL